MLQHNVKHALLRVMVWQMRLMTRYARWVARPMMRAYGNNIIIACGLREADNSASIIYTPMKNHRHHAAYALQGRSWVVSPSRKTQNFSGSCVRRVSLPDAREDAVYRVMGSKENGRRLASPTITVKKETVRDPSLMDITPLDEGKVLFRWDRARRHNPMIYFLAVENAQGITDAAIYTRERFWRYPDIEKASYSVGPEKLPPLFPRKRYIARLVLVDYDGWVSHIAEKQFVFQQI